ncbi:glycosyl transferase [Yeosuana aromativorans]|uniref:Glycosyl transferase n=1 Tax=Yeosuana aromativorans TaxID=288019 RepID=A0A8J3BJ90_9FLAO|nr:glycosyltransferase [Yeosuana aromativorans]GGK25558.1 glycosyl transferase [Yeosuana aromativorans]
MKPFFSVIVPLYNKEAFVEKTIKSVLNQTFTDFEIIVVDDGSTDNSFQILSQFTDSRIQIIKQTNNGVSSARNSGIKNARADYIALLDADDYWYNNHLAELKKQIELFPVAGLYCNNYEVFYTETVNRPAQINLDYKEECLLVPDFFKASIVNPVAWTSAVCFSKTIFNTIGQFRTHLKTAQDLDLWIRFALKYKVSFNPKITMAYKIHVKNSLSKKEYNDIRYDFINSFAEEEKNNASLKLYLDVNRYALALRCKIKGDNKIYQKLKKQIDYRNLNLKQKILLNCSKPILILIKQFQKYLIKKNIYLTAFK